METWMSVAKEAELIFSTYVDWNELYFTCPECGDPVYRCDFVDDPTLALGYCPVCGAALLETCERENYYEAEEEEE